MDSEKRKFQQRQHYCILVAESFDRRYFNVIQILSLNVPMVAIQADLIESNDQYILHFSKILDIYVEIEDEEDAIPVSEETWATKYPWSLISAKKMLDIIKNFDIKATINYTKSYISIAVNNRNSYMFDKRTKPNSMFWFNVKDEEKQESIKKVLNEKDISYNFTKYKDFNLTINQDFMDNYKEELMEIHNIRHKELKNEEE